MGMFGIFAERKVEGSSSVSAFTERRDMGLYEVSLSMSLFWDRYMLTNFYNIIMRYYVVVLTHTREECESKWTYMF